MSIQTELCGNDQNVDRYKKDAQSNGVYILYISLLKRLINDQYRRLESLADLLDMLVKLWHDDGARSKKRKQKKSLSGIILFTPELIESLLVRDAEWIK